MRAIARVGLLFSERENSLVERALGPCSSWKMASRLSSFRWFACRRGTCDVPEMDGAESADTLVFRAIDDVFDGVDIIGEPVSCQCGGVYSAWATPLSLVCRMQ